jgi:hypothetical protein
MPSKLNYGENTRNRKETRSIDIARLQLSLCVFCAVDRQGGVRPGGGNRGAIKVTELKSILLYLVFAFF